MSTTGEQMRAWTGPAILTYGFRPFFLGGAIWAALAMALWVFMLTGRISLPIAWDPVGWHAHEFLFGYLGAVVAGFLLTAVPNWTGGLPIVGWRLAALFALWVAGRVAVLASVHLPVAVAPAVDLAFPLVLGGLILREIVVGKNWRNLIVLGLLAVFTLANGIFHVEALTGGAHAAQGIGLRLGLATAIMMIAVIGGRIIPSFTRNWLAKENEPVRPVPPMQRFDKLVLVASVAILTLWVLRPLGTQTGVALMALGGLHLVRQARWQPHHTWREPLLWVLHAAYLFICLGAVTLGLDQILGKPDTAEAQHLWMAGAIGAMTLAVMTRASLGHTGQCLTANPATVAIYICLFSSVLMRVLASVSPGLMYLSGVFWLAAFAGFVLAYGPLLLRPKPGK